VKGAWQKKDSGGWREEVLMPTSKKERFPHETTQECQYHPTYSTIKRIHHFLRRDLFLR